MDVRRTPTPEPEPEPEPIPRPNPSPAPGAPLMDTRLSRAAWALAFARAVCGAITSGRGESEGSENEGSSVGVGVEEVEGGKG